MNMATFNDYQAGWCCASIATPPCPYAAPAAVPPTLPHAVFPVATLGYPLFFTPFLHVINGLPGLCHPPPAHYLGPGGQNPAIGTCHEPCESCNSNSAADTTYPPPHSPALQRAAGSVRQPCLVYRSGDASSRTSLESSSRSAAAAHVATDDDATTAPCSEPLSMTQCPAGASRASAPAAPLGSLCCSELTLASAGTDADAGMAGAGRGTDPRVGVTRSLDPPLPLPLPVLADSHFPFFPIHTAFFGTLSGGACDVPGGAAGGTAAPWTPGFPMFGCFPRAGSGAFAGSGDAGTADAHLSVGAAADLPHPGGRGPACAISSCPTSAVAAAAAPASAGPGVLTAEDLVPAAATNLPGPVPAQGPALLSAAHTPNPLGPASTSLGSMQCGRASVPTGTGVEGIAVGCASPANQGRKRQREQPEQAAAEEPQAWPAVAAAAAAADGAGARRQPADWGPAAAAATAPAARAPGLVGGGGGKQQIMSASFAALAAELQAVLAEETGVLSTEEDEEDEEGQGESGGWACQEGVEEGRMG